MPYRPALTHDQLRLIGQRRNPDDIRELLWEVKRLRAMVLRAHSLVTSLESVGGQGGIMLEGLREELKDEPCVLEFRKVKDMEGG